MPNIEDIERELDASDDGGVSHLSDVSTEPSNPGLMVLDIDIDNGLPRRLADRLDHADRRAYFDLTKTEQAIVLAGAVWRSRNPGETWDYTTIAGLADASYPYVNQTLGEFAGLVDSVKQAYEESLASEEESGVEPEPEPEPGRGGGESPGWVDEIDEGDPTDVVTAFVNEPRATLADLSAEFGMQNSALTAIRSKYADLIAENTDADVDAIYQCGSDDCEYAAFDERSVNIHASLKDCHEDVGVIETSVGDEPEPEPEPESESESGPESEPEPQPPDVIATPFESQEETESPEELEELEGDGQENHIIILDADMAFEIVTTDVSENTARQVFEQLVDGGYEPGQQALECPVCKNRYVAGAISDHIQTEHLN